MCNNQGSGFSSSTGFLLSVIDLHQGTHFNVSNLLFLIVLTKKPQSVAIWLLLKPKQLSYILFYMKRQQCSSYQESCRKNVKICRHKITREILQDLHNCSRKHKKTLVQFLRTIKGYRQKTLLSQINQVLNGSLST